MESGTVVTILPCNDLDASERFYGRLGFVRIDKPIAGEPDTYRMLSNGKGRLHLTAAVERWLVPRRNPFGLDFYMEDLEAWATVFGTVPKDMSWGMYEFVMSDPCPERRRCSAPGRSRL